MWWTPSYVQKSYEQETRYSGPEDESRDKDVEEEDDEEVEEKDEEDEDYEEDVGLEGTDEDECDEKVTKNEHINFTAYEFAAWIQQEGRIGRLLALINSSKEGDEDDSEPLLVAEMTNWLVPIIPLDGAVSFVPMDFDPSRVVELAVGSIFRSTDVVTIVVGLWCLKSGREAEPNTSEPTRTLFRCRIRTHALFRCML